MTKWGKVDYKQMKEFQKKLQQLNDLQQEFCEAAAKELAARLLAKVIRRTPVGKPPKGEKTVKVKVASSTTVTRKAGNGTVSYKRKTMRTMYWAGYTGGTLRRGWVSKSHEEAASGGGKPAAQDGAAYAQSLPIQKQGNAFVVDIVNPVDYASYVEYGHRQTPGRYVPQLGKKLKGGWIQGKFMLTVSVDELQRDAPKILEKKLAKWLGEALNGK